MKRCYHLGIFLIPALLFACGLPAEPNRNPGGDEVFEERNPNEPEFDCSLEDGCPTASASPGLSAYSMAGKITLPGSESCLKYTRLTAIGDESNITKIYFAIHGDGNIDYANVEENKDSTASDRAAMATHLEPGEGALVVFPISKSDHWPCFDNGKNGAILLKMFRELEKLTGNSNMRFEQFSHSGGGRANHALLRLINENYSSDPDVKEFVDNHLRGIHDGDSLCYSIPSMRDNYIKAIQSFPQINFCFIHNTSDYMEYVQKHHNAVAKAVSGQTYSYGGSLTLQDGRLRFWSAKTHWTAWHTQFERVFFGDNTTPPPPSGFIGSACESNDGCSAGACLTTFHYPDVASFPDGMCTQGCTKLCPDKSGEPETFCITFDTATGRYEGNAGQCFSRCDTSIYTDNGGCRSGYTCVKMARHNQSSTKRNVCVPADKSDSILVGEPADEEGNLPNPEKVAEMGCSLGASGDGSALASLPFMLLITLLSLGRLRRNRRD